MAGGRRVAFAHNAEAEFASLLDFYGVEWAYEPRTFVLETGPDGSPTLAFTPDFHLPEFDRYIDHNLGRRGQGFQLPHGQADQAAIDARLPPRRPRGGQTLHLLIDQLAHRPRTGGHAQGVGAGGLVVGLVGNHLLGQGGIIFPIGVPGEQHLHRHLANLTAWNHAGEYRRGCDFSPRGHGDTETRRGAWNLIAFWSGNALIFEPRSNEATKKKFSNVFLRCFVASW